MESPERRREQEGHGGTPNDQEPDSQLDRLRAAGEGFLAAGDEAIRRALSGDSEAFLRANRQRGGE